jgi:1-acyl-sn-glycerol-3-phosphate acyltransferase
MRLLGLWRVVRGRPASCSADMARLLAAAPRPPRVEGVEHIPPAGPLLVTHNHYCRPGLGAWWSTSLVFTAVARRRGADPVWLVASEWYYLDPLRSATVTPLTRWTFGRAAGVWRFLPMPPDERELARRAAAVRRVLQETRRIFAAGGTSPSGGGALGIAPEGRGEDVLVEPPTGAGRFLLRLAAAAPVLPVGIYEEDSALVARFGPAYRLTPFSDEDKRAEDQRITTEVMTAIAALLPASARGPYADGRALS